jgi:hypothetical protein
LTRSSLRCRTAHRRPRPLRRSSAISERLHHRPQQIFAKRLAGHSVAGIACALNERGVPCPSGADPDRNRHRSCAGRTLRTAATILANPRYTGRQVWNRQNTSTTNQDAPRWAPGADWVISKEVAHTPLQRTIWDGLREGTRGGGLGAGVPGSGGEWNWGIDAAQADLYYSRIADARTGTATSKCRRRPRSRVRAFTGEDLEQAVRFAGSARGRGSIVLVACAEIVVDANHQHCRGNLT